jgi:hypothetical protein
MRPDRPALLLALLAAGCASPAAPVPRNAEALAADRARRDERQKIMQEYWQGETGQRRDAGPTRSAAPRLLHYPAGTYDGVAFAPRLAADPSLAEPAR